MAGVSSSSGKLYYYEPNGSSDTAIPHKYEDYCIAVDLVIEKKNRSDYGGEAEVQRAEYSSSNGTISMMGGTNGALTTSYVDIGPTSKGGLTESIGISSIHIAYQSWFYPEVNIKFVDIRGAGLMVSAEEGYQNNTESTQQSFYDMLFRYPYPLVKLKVKGFYGKGVTYNLALSKFNAEFDPEVGNFVINADFIGYIYGIYADFPLNYCTVAP